MEKKLTIKENILFSKERTKQEIRNKKLTFFDELKECKNKVKEQKLSKEEFLKKKDDLKTELDNDISFIKNEVKDYKENIKKKISKLKNEYKENIDIQKNKKPKNKENIKKIKKEFNKEYNILKNNLKGKGDDDNNLHSKSEYKKILNELNSKFNLEKKESFRGIYKKNVEGKFFEKYNKHIAHYKFAFQDSEYIVELRDVQKYYPNDKKVQQVLKDINLKIKPGEIISIVGPSGSGKSTLFNIISGLIQVERGDVIINQRNLTHLNEKKRTKFREDNISFVFQRYNLISTLKCKDNILLGQDLKLDKEKSIKLDVIAKILGIEKQLNKYPWQLSGGQQQRVSIGRAIGKNPNILLADEPTGALDHNTTKDILKLFVDINEKFNTTIFIITHNSEIAKMADKIIKIGNGEIKKITTHKRIKINDLNLDV